jgi:pimeloyl-ACP methyl ester carboxylesterase
MKLLFIPGSGCGKEEMYYQTRYFAGSEAVVLPGHPSGKPCTSIEEYADWLHAYIHQKQYRNVVLAGHSMGSAVAMTYALKNPVELKALVLMGSGAKLRVLPAFLESLAKWGPQDADWIKFAEAFYQKVDPTVRKIIMEERMRIGPAVTLNDLRCCDKFDIIARVPEIKLPTLLLVGSQDQMTPPKYSQFLADRIAGSTQVVIPDGTHSVYAEKPKEVNQAIEDFINKLK